MIKRTIWHPDEIVWCLIVLQPVFVIMINLCFFCGKLYFVEKNCRGLMLFSFLWNSISGSPTACFKSMINDKFWRQIWVLFHTIFMELLKTNVHAINLKNTFRMHLWKSLQVKCLCFHLFSVSNCCCCWPANILSHISSNFALQFGPDFCGGAVLKYYFLFVTFLPQKSWPSRFKILGDHDLKVKPYFVALCGDTALKQSGLYLSLKKVWHFHIVQNFSQNNWETPQGTFNIYIHYKSGLRRHAH